MCRFRVAEVVHIALQVKLQSSDSQLFEVDEEVATESLTIKNMIEGAPGYCSVTHASC